MQSILLLCLILLTTGFTICVHAFAARRGKVWVFAYSASLLLAVQWLSDLSLGIAFYGLYFHLASVLLFPSIIISLFVTYLFRGVKETRQQLLVLIAIEIGYMAMITVIHLLGLRMPYQDGFGLVWLRNHISSMIALIIDFGVITLLWPLINSVQKKTNSIPYLGLKVAIVLWLTLMADAIIFNLGAFGGSPEIISLLLGNFWVRNVVTLILAPALIWYVGWQDKQEGSQLLEHEWGDVFWKKELIREVEEARSKIENLEELHIKMKEKERLLAEQNIRLELQQKAMANVLDDVTREKEKVQRQAEELKRFEAAANQSIEMMVFTDANGIVLWGNKAVEITTGFTVKETVGLKAGVLWGKLMDKSWYQELWKTVKEDKKTFVGEITNHRKNGERFLSQITVYPIVGKNGEVEFLVSTQRDITKEKEIDRMKSEFISVASHQLRTPLSAIKWFLEMLINGDMGELDKKQLEVIQNIDASNERMILLVNELLSISRIEKGTLEVTPALISIDVWQESLQKELEGIVVARKQKLDLKIESIHSQLFIDNKLVNQIINNLVSNASKYSEAEAQISVKVVNNNNQIAITIKDHGIGIPEKDKAHIFERFYRATNARENSAEGTGLGLYWAKILTEKLGGRISFESEVNKGATFVVTIPVRGGKNEANLDS